MVAAWKRIGVHFCNAELRVNATRGRVTLQLVGLKAFLPQNVENNPPSPTPTPPEGRQDLFGDFTTQTVAVI